MILKQNGVFILKFVDRTNVLSCVARVARHRLLVACVRCWGGYVGEIWVEMVRKKYFSCCMNLFRVFACFVTFLMHTFVQCARVLLHTCSKSFKTLAMTPK